MFFLSQLLIFFKRGVQASRSVLSRADIRITASNTLRLNHARLLKTRVRIKGTNNTIESYGIVSASSLHIEGQNNRLFIGEGCNIRNSRITINGADCEVRFERNATTGGVELVCMGKGNSVHIGEECMIADMVDIWASDTHPILNAERMLLNPSRPIKIDKHVWIGRHVKILKGVHIGSGSVIGMNSLVTRNIPPHSLYAGSPAKCIRENIVWDRGFITSYESNNEEA